MKKFYEGFERDFLALLKKAKKKPVTVKQVLSFLSGKGKLLFLIFFLLPFSQIPGISVVFGLFIFYIGLRMAFHKQSIWLPISLQKRKIPFFFVKQTVKQILFGLNILKRFSKPRLTKVTRRKSVHRLNGVVIALGGLAISFCPPVPIVGLIGFIAILCIGIGQLNEDGMYLVLGYLAAFFHIVLTVFILEIYSLTKMMEFAREFF